jgi:hypothetical protein
MFFNDMRIISSKQVLLPEKEEYGEASMTMTFHKKAVNGNDMYAFVSVSDIGYYHVVLFIKDHGISLDKCFKNIYEELSTFEISMLIFYVTDIGSNL